MADETEKYEMIQCISNLQSVLTEAQKEINRLKKKKLTKRESDFIYMELMALREANDMFLQSDDINDGDTRNAKKNKKIINSIIGKLF